MKNKKLLTTLSFLICFVIGALFVYQTVVHARAGGGDDFGSGGFDSGSSFDSDSSSSSGSTFISSGTEGGGGSSFNVLYCVGIIVAVIIFVVIAKKMGWIKKGTPAATPPAWKRGVAPMKQPLRADEVQADIAEKKKALKESDSHWNEQRFLDTAETIFHTVQEAWTKNELAIARAFLSDSVYTRFKKQLGDLKKRGLRNVLENIVVGSTEIVKIAQDKDFDTVTVKIRASMIDYKVDEKSGNMVSGAKEQSPPFTEFWTFLRKAGTKTRDVPTVKEKKCPNCGAPLEINESGKCKFCKANVVSGDFDWVLSKITQRDDWKV